MLLTAPQLCALYALRQAAPIMDISEHPCGTRIVAIHPDGRVWHIDMSGTTTTQTEETQT